MRRRLIPLAFILAAAVGIPGLPAAADEPGAALERLRLDQPVTERVTPPSKLGAGLSSATGQQRVVVELEAAPAARVAARGRSLSTQRAQARVVTSVADQVLARARQLDPDTEELARTRVALSSLILRMDAAAARTLAAEPAVARVRAVVDHTLDLDETVPYIGARNGAAADLRGEGVRVAVLDSGVDYTHEKLGGAGTDAAYQRAYGDSADITEPNPAATANTRRSDENGAYFPTAKVVDGFDYVGEFWPEQPETSDPNPIDLEGHGTSVSDIIGGIAGGAGNDEGVAPDVDLIGVKVCATFSSSCSGIALLQGMDFALDPNGDGDTDDAADVINMSLGSDYGTAPDDALSAAVENATDAGVLTVASAGNGGDKPFVSGTPAATPSALSVAQTNVPSASLAQLRVTSPPEQAAVFDAVFQPWSAAPTDLIDAEIEYGVGDNKLGCEAFPEDSLTGKVVMVDRGGCNASFKIAYIQKAGGILGIIGFVDSSEPFEFGFGGTPPDAAEDIEIPGYAIDREDADRIRDNPDTLTGGVDPNQGIPLVGTMVGSSSRGPGMETHLIKPEIGAPGASVSAIAGSGTDKRAFGGTSGAAPMVAGAAAQLIEAFPNRSPEEIKAVLINNGETDIRQAPEAQGGELAPITRIGGGEVRVDRAAGADTAAFDSDRPSAALSFGFPEVADDTVTLTRDVTVRNYSNAAQTYQVSSAFRFAEDEGGAVQLAVPPSVTVPANGTAEFPATLTIDGADLPLFTLNSGATGADSQTLTDMEVDGYVTLRVGDEEAAHLPWQVLPRQAADVEPTGPVVPSPGGGTLPLRNDGIGTAGVDAYSLIGTSRRMTAPDPQGDDAATIDLRAAGVQTIPVPGNFCSADPSFVLAFAASSFDRQTHANAPAAFEFDLDLDQDGTADYAVFNLDLAGDNSNGQNVVFAVNLDDEDAPATAFFTTDHGSNGANTVLLVCAEQLGLSNSNLGQAVGVDVLAIDIFYQGEVTDAITDKTMVLGRERYVGQVEDIPANSPGSLDYTDRGQSNSSGEGLLLIQDAERFNDDGGYRTGAPVGNEARVVLLEPGDGQGEEQPPPVIPETPYAALLPFMALAVGSAAFAVRRRRGLASS